MIAYIVLNLEASNDNDIVYGVYSTKEFAINAVNKLNEKVKGGLLTEIICKEIKK